MGHMMQGHNSYYSNQMHQQQMAHLKQYQYVQQQFGAAKIALDNKLNELAVNQNDINLQKEVQ